MPTDKNPRFLLAKFPCYRLANLRGHVREKEERGEKRREKEREKRGESFISLSPLQISPSTRNVSSMFGRQFDGTESKPMPN